MPEVPRDPNRIDDEDSATLSAQHRRQAAYQVQLVQRRDGTQRIRSACRQVLRGDVIFLFFLPFFFHPSSRPWCRYVFGEALHRDHEGEAHSHGHEYEHEGFHATEIPAVHASAYGQQHKLGNEEDAE